MGSTLSPIAHNSHFPTSTLAPVQHQVPFLSHVPSQYPSSTISPIDPSVPLHYHSPASNSIFLPHHSSTTEAPVRNSQLNSVRVSSLPPLRPYYQPTSLPPPPP